MNRSSNLPMENPSEPAEAVRNRRRLHQSGYDRQRRGDENRDEISKLLYAVEANPTVVDRELQRQVLDDHRHGVRKNIPSTRYQFCPLAADEEHHIKSCPVYYPQKIAREMPPAGEADRMANARNAEPSWKRHGVVLGRPDPAGRNGVLKTKPLCARCAVHVPVKARMVGQNLNSRPDNQEHEKQVKKMHTSHP